MSTTHLLARAQAERNAEWVRVGLEQAGHYHRPLQARLETHGLAVTLLNPAQVKANRNQDLLRSLKSDAIDLAAMAELLIRGKGRVPGSGGETIAVQAALAAHRSRKVKTRAALKNQIHAGLDLVFPGLSGCFDTILDTKVGPAASRRRADARASAAVGTRSAATLLLQPWRRSQKSKSAPDN